MLQGDEVQISALKEYVPRGHVWDLCLSFFFSHPIRQNSHAAQQKVVWNIPVPERIFKTIELAG